MVAALTIIILSILLLVPSVCQFLYTDKIDQYKSVKVNFDFNPVIINGDNCSININARAVTSTVEQAFHSIVDTSCDAISSPKQVYELWNFQTYTISYQIIVIFATNQTYYESLYATQMYFTIEKISEFHVHSSQSLRYFVAVLIKDQISQLNLPFNLLSAKNIRVFANYLNNHQLTINNYSIVPFLQTYWNQIDASQILTPWLPFFSNCQRFAPRIFLHQLFIPTNCSVSRSLLGFKDTQCQQQKYEFQCVLQQLSVQNFAKQYWWNSNNKILYHILPKQLSSEQLKQYLTESALQNNLASETFRTTIPVLYENTVDSSANSYPNKFDIEFHVIVNSDDSLEIVTARIIASYKSQLNLTQKHAQLSVRVYFQTFWQRIYYFHESYLIYFGLSLLMNLTVIYLLHSSLKYLGVRLKILQKLKLIIFPVAKGFFYMLTVGLIFVIVFYFISKGTQFSLIATGFNGNPSVGLQERYNGRNGLMLAVSGVFLLISAIHQSFKVPSTEEAHFLLQDDLDQKQSTMYHIVKRKYNNHSIFTFSDEKQQQKVVQSFVQQQNPQKIAQKQNFIVKNLQSQRKFLFFYLLTIQAVLLYFFFNFISLQSWQLGLTIILLYPFGEKLIIMIYRHYIIKQYLYLHGTIILYETFFSVFLLKAKSVQQFYLFYFLKIIADVIIQPFFEFICQFFIIKLNDKPDRNFITLKIWLACREFIKQITEQSQYEKAIFYSGLITSKVSTSYFKPIFILLLYVTLEETNLFNQLHFIESQFIVISIMMTSTILLENYLVLVSARILETKFQIKISECIDFNNFKFSKRKIKWLNDIFNLNRNINNFYREFEKFSFSSQLYLISFLFVLALTCILIGSITIIESSYVLYSDPVLLVIVMAVLLTGIILSFVLSFIVIKLRIYENKQQGKIRAKLQYTEKLLNKKDYSEYLQLDSIKNHFMMFNKNWIVENLTNILSKDDFEQNNCDLITKYKYYKSIAKKKQLQAKKYRQICEQNLIQQVQQNQLRQKETHPRNQQGILVPIPRKAFEEYAKPIIYSWFYLAKQNLYLKSLVKQLRSEKLRPNCQFCNMDIELQVIQKKPFTEIINEFRVVNVGRMFNQTVFVNYYRQHQQFITVCIQCKQKNCHLQKKTIKNAKGMAGKLILRWLMIGRAKKLHISHKGYRKGGVSYEVKK